jgi:hypothetical protein
MVSNTFLDMFGFPHGTTFEAGTGFSAGFGDDASDVDLEP